MATKFSSVICKVLLMVATIATLLFSTGLAAGGPAYDYCFLKCIDECNEFCKRMDYTHGGDCSTGPCCCRW
uniref:Knottin scorpion toxin-like domain-containing protein n=1 Tax=Leersia perrieri TaxID=77586 RepID=A0A0D9XUP1_9ORYZ